MFRPLLSIFCLLLLATGVYSQDITIDSLIRTRKTDSLDGKLKTYYSPGHKKIALELQELVSGAISYYEKKYHAEFHLQLIVLDSAQWFREIVPYGFVFYDDTHWLVLNTGMDYEKFKSVYGLTGISAQLDSSFRKNNITAEEVVYSRLKFISLHELGHYFIFKISSAQAPDIWTGEMIATFFSNEYITQFEPEIKKGFNVFCQTMVKCYPAEHRSLADFDSLYFKMKLGNFAWYHSRFYFLADSLYSCAGNSYIHSFEMNFPKKEGLVFTQETIDRLVESNCTGLFLKWNNASEYGFKPVR